MPNDDEIVSEEMESSDDLELRLRMSRADTILDERFAEIERLMNLDRRRCRKAAALNNPTPTERSMPDRWITSKSSSNISKIVDSRRGRSAAP